MHLFSSGCRIPSFQWFLLPCDLLLCNLTHAVHFEPGALDPPRCARSFLLLNSTPRRGAFDARHTLHAKPRHTHSERSQQTFEANAYGKRPRRVSQRTLTANTPSEQPQRTLTANARSGTYQRTLTADTRSEYSHRTLTASVHRDTANVHRHHSRRTLTVNAHTEYSRGP